MLRPEFERPQERAFEPIDVIDRRVVDAYRGTVHESERRKEVRADLLERNLARPGLVRKRNRPAERIIVAHDVREAALVVDVGKDRLVAEQVRTAILEIPADDRVLGQPGRITIGEDEPYPRLLQHRARDPKRRKELSWRGLR